MRMRSVIGLGMFCTFCIASCANQAVPATTVAASDTRRTEIALQETVQDISMSESVEPVNENSLETTVETQIQPDSQYVHIENFVLEGKWKSVGTYGFGQAQPGAIVIFDGTNCNVFSPSDTYAYYMDGDTMILDCTAMLTSETQSFIIMMIDENDIELHNGGTVTQLRRVG